MTTEPTRLAGILSERIAEIAGFRRRRAGLLTFGSEDPIVGWVGLNVARLGRGPTIELNPVIGIRDNQIEERVADLGGRNRHAYLPPTVSRSLGYLGQEATYVPYYFSIPANSEQIETFLDDFEVTVLPFFDANRNRKRVIDLLNARMVPYDVFAYERLLAVAVDASDVPAAEKIVRKWRPQLEGRTDLAAEGGRAYIEAAASLLGITV